MKKLMVLGLASGLSLGPSVVLRAGGFLESIDTTGNVPSPRPGHVVGRLVPMRWDSRTIPVQYKMNTTLAPIPNPLGAAFLTIGDATTALQRSFDAWNAIPTSYIEMQISGTTSNPGLSGFDLVNELTFRTAASFSLIAASASVTLTADTTLLDGDRIDADADADVSGAITVATDVDGDGDVELPAGFYRAGTILDNDIQFNTKVSNGYRFTTADADVDIVARSVDLMAIATHEAGHSIGLSHTLFNQSGAADGNSSTMFPLLDADDPAAELALRTLESDDVAWASYHYPEGSAASGPAALQSGDIAFAAVYGLITGEVRHGVLNQPVAGASVHAMDWKGDQVVAAGFSGTTQVSVAPNGRAFVVSPAFNIRDGKYVIPVPKGNYAVGIEATDGSPVEAARVGLTAEIGSIFGQMNFTEEFYNGNKEDDIELRPGQRKNVAVLAGTVSSDVNMTTTRNININNFGDRNFIGFSQAPGGMYYAVRVPGSQIIAAAAAGPIAFHSIGYDTAVVDGSVVPAFAEATLATGSSTGATATINLAEPLERVSGFIGQDDDFAPFFFKNGHDLAGRVLQGISDGSITDLFLVLRLPPGPFPGVSAAPPLIGLDGGAGVTNDVPIFGLSYVSDDGGVSFRQNTHYNFRFSLVLSER